MDGICPFLFVDLYDCSAVAIRYNWKFHEITIISKITNCNFVQCFLSSFLQSFSRLWTHTQKNSQFHLGSPAIRLDVKNEFYFHFPNFTILYWHRPTHTNKEKKTQKKTGKIESEFLLMCTVHTHIIHQYSLVHHNK